MKEICAKILELSFFLVHMAPPCSTRSRARAPALRQVGRWITGMPGLTQKQRQRVREGTRLARSCVSFAWACLASETGFSIENPESSMLWRWPPMEELISHPSIIIIDFTYCKFGVLPWLKPTRIVTNIAELRGLMGGCPGGHQHQHLRGMAPTGYCGQRSLAPTRCSSVPHMGLGFRRPPGAALWLDRSLGSPRM